MGHRNKGKPRARQKPAQKKSGPAKQGSAARDRPLAWQQFQELNFCFYEEHPSEFIHMRIEVLSLMLCSEQQLESAYAAERSIKGIRLSGTTPPDEEKRSRYLRTEAVVIFHHAAEMLLRLFYAHVEHPDCPWQGMATLTSFVEFKEKVDPFGRIRPHPTRGDLPRGEQPRGRLRSDVGRGLRGRDRWGRPAPAGVR